VKEAATDHHRDRSPGGKHCEQSHCPDEQAAAALDVNRPMRR
jgi:hypothetical protein